MQRREWLQLLGTAVAVPVLSGLSADQLHSLGRAIHARAAAHRLRALTPAETETIATMADLIIPETDTPGARAAGVHEFIDLIVADHYGEYDRARFKAGIADVDTRSRTLFGADFVSAAEPQRTAILNTLDAEVEALRRGKAHPEDHFFQRVKSLTLFGYYTSEIGMIQELGFEMVPGSFDGCILFAPHRGGDE
jgi:hypothetical protein